MGKSLVKVLCMMMLAAIAAAGVSCSRPVSYEKFVSVEDREANGLYSFSIDLSDSLCTYDVSFYSRIDAIRFKEMHSRDFSLMVTWTAPSGQRYRETVYFGPFDDSTGSDSYSRQYVKPYRRSLVPVEFGTWDIEVLVNSGAEVPGFRGLGIICKKNLPDGTR